MCFKRLFYTSYILFLYIFVLFFVLSTQYQLLLFLFMSVVQIYNIIYSTYKKITNYKKSCTWKNTCNIFPIIFYFLFKIFHIFVCSKLHRKSINQSDDDDWGTAEIVSYLILFYFFSFFFISAERTLYTMYTIMFF